MDALSFVIIGAGPTGIAAAEEAARFGMKVTLVNGDSTGGRATWSSLLPSKVHLTAADTLHSLRNSEELGIESMDLRVNLKGILSRIGERSEAWSTTLIDKLQTAGVQVVTGKASFQDYKSILVESQEGDAETISFDRALIATGSVPVFFPDLKPDGKRILAPKLVKMLDSWPESITVIGGGVTGSEFVYLFNSMGSKVTWVTDLSVLLPHADMEISEALEAEFEKRGVDIFKESPVEKAQAAENGVRVTLQSGQILEASYGFIAIGRRADLDSLNLDAVGVSHDRSGVVVDEHGQTSITSIYAAGDAAGPPYLANRGLAQARVAVRAALGIEHEPYHSEWIVEAIYTEPQIAQVGLRESEAAEANILYEVIRTEYRDNLKAQLGSTQCGILKILVSQEKGIILGGSAIGTGAAEMLASVAVAIRAGLTVDQFADIFPAHPTLSELPFQLARTLSV